MKQTQGAEIFIFDGTVEVLSTLTAAFESAGYQVRTATDGRRGLSMVRAEAPDLILLDITMPGLDGYAICEELEADESLVDVPVVFLSSLDDVFDKVRAFEVGGVDYILKPFQVEEVLVRAGSHLALYMLRRELERRVQELERRCEELLQGRKPEGQKREDRTFSALSGVPPGFVLDGKYRLGTKIGAGGFGTVYEARHQELQRDVAVKVLHPATGADVATMVERFRVEGISACRVNHPNAVSVFDFGISDEGIAYLVMERLEGRTLAEELRELGTVPVARCIQVIGPVCGALSEAHAEGVVHRDVKPSNIFLHQGKSGEVVKVLDFGIAKLVDGTPGVEVRNLTLGRAVIGTPCYLAPERLFGEPYDGKADVYSLGVVLYEMLTGRLPFRAKDPQTLAIRMATHNPPSISEINSDVPLAVDEIVMRALERSPADRPNPDELAAALVAAASDGRATGESPSRTTTRPDWKVVKSLFEGALGLPESEREAFLSNACGGDSALLADVESLLEADELASSFLKTSTKPPGWFTSELETRGPHEADSEETIIPQKQEEEFNTKITEE